MCCMNYIESQLWLVYSHGDGTSSYLNPLSPSGLVYLVTLLLSDVSSNCWLWTDDYVLWIVKHSSVLDAVLCFTFHNLGAMSCSFGLRDSHSWLVCSSRRVDSKLMTPPCPCFRARRSCWVNLKLLLLSLALFPAKSLFFSGVPWILLLCLSGLSPIGFGL